jgi:light-regulated signal transduction histidine kinase (bacteriophytochrome)
MNESNRMRKEEDVRSQLDRANANFEKFVSLASHDLRESLRDIASHSELMSEKYGGRLDSDADGYLARIRASAARAQSLLSDVVEYWATGGEDQQSSPTDMEAALVQALLCADGQIAARSAVVTHDPLPRVSGDFESLTKVLHHLIENAIEYCTAPFPVVHISSRRVDLDCVFSVADNGPGIEPVFQGRVFEPFKRLHGREYPGNGLGLAFCKKTVEWHGGRMWVESAPGLGSTFYFTLPADE